MPPHRNKQRLIFGKTGWAMDFAGCEDIVPELLHVFRGWEFSLGTPADFPKLKPRGTISRRAGGWHWQEQGAPRPLDWDRVPPRTPMRVITDVHDAAIHWYLAEHRDMLCLHGGAVKFGKGLVCFPAKGRSGKSTLIASLAARGHKVFCDDVLGLAPPAERGVSLGLQPRLRVPLAPNLPPATRRFVAAHSGPADRSWRYLKLGKGQIAAFGESAPIAAFVLLERSEGARAKLTDARTSEVLKGIIAENIVRKLPMAEIFERLHHLAATRQRFHLRYGNPDAAAKLLAEAFA